MWLLLLVRTVVKKLKRNIFFKKSPTTFSMGAIPPAPILKRHRSYTCVWVCASSFHACAPFPWAVSDSHHRLKPWSWPGLATPNVRLLLLPCPPWSQLLFPEAPGAPWKLRSEADWWENIKVFDQHFKNFALSLAAKVCGGLQCFWTILIPRLDVRFHWMWQLQTGHIIMI